MTFDYLTLAKEDPNHDVNVSPENGCYVYGLYIECAKWNEADMKLDESEAKVLYSSMCSIYFQPMTDKELAENQMVRYTCPVYKTSARRGTLTTTGHSTNYVCSIFIPLYDHHTPEHWTRRGVACLTQLDE